MRQKIINLTFTLSALAATTYASYAVGLNSDRIDLVEVVEVEEHGLNTPETEKVKLQQLIKTYEVEYPEEVPWKTCLQ